MHSFEYLFYTSLLPKKKNRHTKNISVAFQVATSHVAAGKPALLHEPHRPDRGLHEVPGCLFFFFEGQVSKIMPMKLDLTFNKNK